MLDPSDAPPRFGGGSGVLDPSDAPPRFGGGSGVLDPSDAPPRFGGGSGVLDLLAAPPRFGGGEWCAGSLEWYVWREGDGGLKSFPPWVVNVEGGQWWIENV